MCNLCDKAVAFWNGTSYGVKCNIERIKKMNKPLEIILDEFDIPHSKAEQELNLEDNLAEFGILQEKIMKAMTKDEISALLKAGLSL